MKFNKVVNLGVFFSILTCLPFLAVAKINSNTVAEVVTPCSFIYSATEVNSVRGHWDNDGKAVDLGGGGRPSSVNSKLVCKDFKAYASISGRVKLSYDDSSCPAEITKYGPAKVIIIEGKDGISVKTWHHSSFGVFNGQEVKAGEYIGEIGNTGCTDGFNHIHFVLFKNNTPQVYSNWKFVEKPTVKDISPKISSEYFNDQIIQLRVNSEGNVFTRNSNGAHFDEWEPITGSTNSQIAMRTFNGELYASTIGKDGSVYVNKYDEGNWGSWKSIGGAAQGDPALVVYKNKIYMFVRGKDNNIYSTSFNGAAWSSFKSRSGTTKYDLDAIVYNNNLYLNYVDAKTNKVYSLDFDGTQWKKTFREGVGRSRIKSYVFKKKVYQTIVGKDSKVYYREVKGTTWGSWIYTSGKSNDYVSIVSFNNELYMSARGVDNKIYIRRLNVDNVWDKWRSYNSGATSAAIESFVNIGTNTLFQSVNDISSDMVHTRYLKIDGSWSNWD